jgi:hypothetical protein
MKRSGAWILVAARDPRFIAKSNTCGDQARFNGLP